jgi:hypothetical protein
MKESQFQYATTCVYLSDRPRHLEERHFAMFVTADDCINALTVAINENAPENFASISQIMAQLPNADENHILGILRSLKTEGQVTFPDRGRNARARYELVKAPVEKAPVEKAPTEATVKAPTEATEKAPTEATEKAPTEATVKAPVVKAPVKTTEIPEARPLDPGEGYGTDPYYARVAADMTPCFGGWVPRSKTCDGCALRINCRDSAIAELHVMAARWTTTTTTTTIPEAPTPPAHPVVRAPFVCLCVECSTEIPVGEPMVVDPTTKPNKQGVYHPACC